MWAQKHQEYTFWSQKRQKRTLLLLILFSNCLLAWDVWTLPWRGCETKALNTLPTIWLLSVFFFSFVVSSFFALVSFFSVRKCCIYFALTYHKRGQILSVVLLLGESVEQTERKFTPTDVPTGRPASISEAVFYGTLSINIEVGGYGAITFPNSSLISFDTVPYLNPGMPVMYRFGEVINRQQLPHKRFAHLPNVRNLLGNPSEIFRYVITVARYLG